MTNNTLKQACNCFFDSLQDILRLGVGDKLDHRDYLGKWAYAKIVDRDDFSLKIHYRGYDTKYDVWVPIYKTCIRNFAKPKSISQTYTEDFPAKIGLTVNDSLTLTVNKDHYEARVVKFCDKSDQVQVAYGDNNKVWWISLLVRKEWSLEKIEHFQHLDVTTCVKNFNFTPHLTWKEAKLLKEGDFVDYRQLNGRYRLSKITKVNVFKKSLQITILGIFGKNEIKKFNIKPSPIRLWIPSRISQIAKAYSISKRRGTRLPYVEVGDDVEINPPDFRSKGQIYGNEWVVGKVLQTSPGYGMVQVQWEDEYRQIRKIWIHKDHEEEIRAFSVENDEMKEDIENSSQDTKNS